VSPPRKRGPRLFERNGFPLARERRSSTRERRSASRERRSASPRTTISVAAAKAGAQLFFQKILGSRFRGNDDSARGNDGWPRRRRLGAFLLCFALAGAAHALDHRQLALVVNTADPLSVAIGEYYAERRAIGFQNVIRVSIPPGRAALTRQEFEKLKRVVDARTNPRVQAYALAWALPYRVECMSITSAFAYGYDDALCSQGCKPTRPSRYFNSKTREPYADLGLRPAMALAARTLGEAKALIDRGVAADRTRPPGTAYLVSTSDELRNVRSRGYPLAVKAAGERFEVRTVHADALTYRTDVLFYFTGAARVPLDTVRFVPGAMADHLTSSGGVLDAGEGGQMSALAWLEAGATASYGTVVEPCNLPQKFPHPAVAIAHYLAGETAIEAYWKSVRMPGQGIFVGEPLAAPFTR